MKLSSKNASHDHQRRTSGAAFSSAIVRASSLVAVALYCSSCLAISSLAPKEITIKAAVYGWADLQDGRFVEAEAKFREAIQSCRRDAEPRCVMTNTINLGTALSKQGKLLPALQAQEQALAAAQQMGLPKFELFAEVNRAVVEITLFRFEAALRHSIAATELADREEHKLLRGLARALQARSLVALGNPGGALALAEEAERILRQSRYHGFEQELLAYHLTAMAQVWQLLGDCDRAAHLSREAVDLLPQAFDLNRPLAYLGLARCAARGQKHKEELEHLRRARGDLTAWRTRTGAANSPISRDLDALLDAATYEAQRALDPGSTPSVSRSAYGFALLRQLDGENAEALRSLLAVPAANEDFDRAQEFAEALRERVRIVEGGPLELRESPTTEAAILRSIDMGSWVEVLGEAGGWRKLRYLDQTGFSDLGGGQAWLREAQ